jgi:hypothetical protein
MMKISFRPAFLLLLPLLPSCMNIGLVRQDDLARNAYAMEASGRQGWTFNKTLSFGPYHTNKFDIGSSTETSKEHIGWFFRQKTITTNREQEIIFKLFDSTGRSIEVMCEDVFNTVKDWSGPVYQPRDSSAEVYSIHLYFENREYAAEYHAGSTFNLVADGATILVEEEKIADNARKLSFNGLLFKRGQETLGAVELTNSGCVWIRSSLDDKTRMFVAALSAALLMKPVHQ